MDPIPAWVRKLWGAWDMRILVLLSLTLQIMLCIFGHRRKYIKSQWISILLWLAYLMADWVATVVLGKLSDESTSNNNNTTALRAIWAPLLLLHLGGPDTITAYSLEDNQLWMRHLMGLAVQLVVAVYVVLLSWRNFEFSYFSFPALVAGIIKYGERIWVLKSVCNDRAEYLVPFCSNDRNPEIPENAEDSEREYIRTLFLAHRIVWVHRYTRIFNYPKRVRDRNLVRSENFRDQPYCWNVLEVAMGFTYDILFTKAAKTYRKSGCILRSISFACTMSILVGLFWRISRKEKWLLEQDMFVDVIITGLLLVGALALEIYALTMLLTSDWTMIWLIQQKREKLVIQLGQKVPWLFPMHRKRRWSNKMGQFDALGLRRWSHKKEQFDAALGFHSKQSDMNTSMLSRVLWLPGIQDKFSKCIHKTSLDVPDNLYSMISRYLHFLSYPNARLHEQEMFDFVEDPFELDPHCVRDFEYQLFHLYFATQILLNKEGNTSGGEGADNKIISQILSRYMMYLYMEHSSLLLALVEYEDRSLDLLIDSTLQRMEDATQNGRTISKSFTKYLMEKPEGERWRILKTKWLEMICYVALKAEKHNHLQQLTQGGELLTLVRCFIARADRFEGIDDNNICYKFNNLRRLI